MKYFYNLDGRNVGPVSPEELQALARQGVIKGKTPVIEEGGAQWTRYAQLSGGAPLPAVPGSQSILRQFLSVNRRIDTLIGKILRVPAVVPRDESGRIELLDRWNGVMSLVVWAGYTAIGIAAGVNGKEAGVPFLAAAAGCFVLGFFMQYIFYWLYSLTTSLLLGQRLVLSSMAAPRLLAIVGLLLVFASVVALFMASGVAEVTLFLILTLVSYGMAGIFFHADDFIVAIRPAEVSPGRELNNFFRLILRGFFLSAHVLAPLLIALSALTLAVMPFGEIGEAFLHLGVMALPFFTFLGLCLTSWFFDLFDGIFALGGNRQS